MPLLNWSPRALAALHDKGQRQAMTQLFDAYFRVAEGKDLTGTVLHLDLPAATQPDPRRYDFSARFTKKNGWVVYATLKREYRILS